MKAENEYSRASSCCWKPTASGIKAVGDVLSKSIDRFARIPPGPKAELGRGVFEEKAGKADLQKK